MPDDTTPASWRKGCIVLVCGGRDYNNDRRVNEVLSRLMPSIVIQGGASGADRLAAEWGNATGTTVAYVPAQWKSHGKAAGPIRNSQMARLNPQLVVAFPGGRGTRNMVTVAESEDIPVMRVDW